MLLLSMMNKRHNHINTSRVGPLILSLLYVWMSTIGVSVHDDDFVFVSHPAQQSIHSAPGHLTASGDFCAACQWMEGSLSQTAVRSVPVSPLLTVLPDYLPLVYNYYLCNFIHITARGPPR